jgi:hypothetical protein
MRLSVAEIMGEVASFLREPELLKEGFLLFQVNHACQAIYNEMREAWGEKHLVESTADLVADQSLYDLPATCDNLRKLERLDPGDTTQYFPVNRIPFTMRDKMLYRPLMFPEYEGLSYVLVPGNAKIELMEPATTALTAGLKYTFYPKWVEVTTVASYPDTIPVALHEVIIAKTLERVIPRNGGQVVNEKAAYQFIADQRETLKRYLYPPDSERAMELDVENDLYEGPFYP